MQTENHRRHELFLGGAKNDLKTNQMVNYHISLFLEYFSTISRP